MGICESRDEFESYSMCCESASTVEGKPAAKIELGKATRTNLSWLEGIKDALDDIFDNREVVQIIAIDALEMFCFHAHVHNVRDCNRDHKNYDCITTKISIGNQELDRVFTGFYKPGFKFVYKEYSEWSDTFWSDPVYSHRFKDWNPNASFKVEQTLISQDSSWIITYWISDMFWAESNLVMTLNADNWIYGMTGGNLASRMGHPFRGQNYLRPENLVWRKDFSGFDFIDQFYSVSHEPLEDIPKGIRWSLSFSSPTV